MRKSILTIAAGIALGSFLVASSLPADAGSPIKARKELMQTNKLAAMTAGAMVKGKRAYDAQVAELAMRTIAATAYGLEHLFPKGSETGEKTRAKAEIWKDMKGFLERMEGMEDKAEEAAEAAKKGLGAFKMAFGDVIKTCKGCHEKYRAEKKK